MKITINLNNLPKITNPIYYPLYSNTARYLVLYGGAGSGKSFFTAKKILVRCILEPKSKFLICRKVSKTLRHSVFSQLKEIINIWGWNSIIKENKTEMTFYFPLTKSSIITVGADDVEKLKSISGITSIWIEEATELTQDDFQQIDLRLRGRGRHYKQIILTFNPIDYNHWLNKMFCQNEKRNSFVLRTTYKDNLFIDEEYKQVLESIDDDYFYTVYTLGKWGTRGETIYTNYEIREIPYSLDDFDEVYQGLDFGFNNPCAWVLVGIKDEILYILDCFRKSKLTNSEFAGIVRNRLGNSYDEFLAIADSSEPDRIKEFSDLGFNIIPTKKGNNSVMAGIDWIRSRKTIINPECQEFINEIQQYKFKKDKNGNYLDEPVKFNDHLMDAFRYAVEEIRLRNNEFGVVL